MSSSFVEVESTIEITTKNTKTVGALRIAEIGKENVECEACKEKVTKILSIWSH